MRRLNRMFTRARGIDARLIDALVAAALLAATVTDAFTGRHHHGVLVVLGAVVVSATVAWRRRAPALATLSAVGGIVLYGRTSGQSQLTFEPVAVLLDYYMLGRVPGTRRNLLDAGLLALAVAGVVLTPGNPAPIDVAATWALFVVIPFAAGRAVASRSALNRELRASADRLEREQEERALRAAAEERNRIARELHDVVAHSVSVMVIQTAAARRVAGEDPDAAREALSSVEACGRDALIEMRRMVGVLRRGDIELAAPAPGLSHLPALAERARAAGLPVELRVEGEPLAVPPGLDLVAYRVVQEALTNAIKHAGPARARVHVKFTPDLLELDVSDTGGGPANPDVHAGGGHGLVGMRERITLYGGELYVGRGRGGGFRVQARLPLREAVMV
jgi:signal transduction histidine kinase